MNEDTVRGRLEDVGAALIAGDIDRVIGTLSDELRRNLGEVVALLPLPATAVNIESIERTGSGYAVVVELIGATEQVRIQTRWKERDGEATIVEISHLSRAEREAELAGEDLGEVDAATTKDAAQVTTEA